MKKIYNSPEFTVVSIRTTGMLASSFNGALDNSEENKITNANDLLGREADDFDDDF